MKSSSVLIVGCGDLGTRVGTRLVQQGWRVTGVRRNAAQLPAEFERVAADYTHPGSLQFIESLRPDFVLATFTPLDRTVAGYRAGFGTAMNNLLAGLGTHQPRHLLMASSTRVFAESNGGWVDETSALTADDPQALEIIAAERQLLDSGFSASIVRFAGIYGSPEGRLVSRIQRGELCPPAPVSYTNRIHRDDCAGFLVHLLQSAEADATLLPVYIGVDDLPAPRYEVESWIAAQLGVQNIFESGPAPRAQSTSLPSAANKRCRNISLHDSGYQLKYPDYRSGYGALLAMR